MTESDFQGSSEHEELLPFSLSHSNNLAVLTAGREGPVTPSTPPRSGGACYIDLSPGIALSDAKAFLHLRITSRSIHDTRR